MLSAPVGRVIEISEQYLWKKRKPLLSHLKIKINFYRETGLLSRCCTRKTMKQTRTGRLPQGKGIRLVPAVLRNDVKFSRPFKYVV